MDTVKQVIDALHQKKTLFDEYEAATRALQDCEIDDMSDYITKRTQLSISIDEIDARLRNICDEIPHGDLLSDVIANRCMYSNTPPEWKTVFEAGQEVLAVVGRIVDLEKGVLERMHTLHTELKQKIADTHNTPKIARYLSEMGGRSMGAVFIKDQA